MKIIKNFLYNASYQVFILLIPLVTTPYLARVLGPTGVGINSYTNSIIQYFILFGSIGVNLYGNRQIAFVREDKKELSNTFFEIFIMRLVTVFLAYFAFLIFLGMINQYHKYYIMQSISIIAAAFDISWFFMGMEDFAVTVLRNLLIKLVTLVSIFSFVKSQNDLAIYIMILSLSLLFGNLTLFPKLKKYVFIPKFKSLKVWRHLKPSLLLFIPQIATQIYLVVNKTMLGSMTSVQAAGYFDQSDKLVKMILAVVTATGTVMLPHVAHAFARGRYEQTKKYLYVSFQFVTAVSVPMMFGLMAVSEKFVPLFFTDKFLQVVPLITIESIVILVIAWSNVLGTQYLLPTKQIKLFTTSVIIGAIVNVCINIPLIALWGAIGTTIATVLSELVVTGYQMYSIRKQVSYRLLFTDVIKYLISGFIMWICVYTLDRVLPDSWLMIGLEVLVGIIIYIILILVFRVKIIKIVLGPLKKRIQ